MFFDYTIEVFFQFLFYDNTILIICILNSVIVDLKLRGRKENSGDVTDYDESSANSNSNSSLFLVILVALCLCLHHHPQMRTLHPA